MINGWHGWVSTVTGVVLITVAALPLAALAVWALARRRSTSEWAWRKSLAEVGIVYGTVPWVWMIMLPGSQAGAVPGRVSLVPLRDLLTMSTDQVVGNLLVFAALGFFVPLRFAALASVPRILALAAGCSALLETAQYVLRLDRVSSVDDVLLNAAGAGLAALASRRWWRGGLPGPRRPGLSARLKLTISYAGFVLLAGALLLAVVWVFLLRYVPDSPRGLLWIAPNRAVLLLVFGPAAATALVVLLVIGLLGGWILAGRMLAPLTRIADAARMASNGSLSHRIRLPGRQDEFRELADVFDTMLEQLEAHVAEQERFAANASHELRTPLAISQTLLDVALNDPTRDQGELIERLHTVNTRAIDLTEALLLLSRGDRGSFTHQPVDLSLIAEEATETLLPLAEKRSITLNVTGETTHTVGSETLILRMVMNLVQNAIVHNLPADGTVTVHTESESDASVLRVENTGHPLPLELVPTLTEPFQRGTARTRPDAHAGVGLGLAIVHSIVRAHDGTLDLTPRPTGGLLVTIRLPQASSRSGSG